MLKFEKKKSSVIAFLFEGYREHLMCIINTSGVALQLFLMFLEKSLLKNNRTNAKINSKD